MDQVNLYIPELKLNVMTTGHFNNAEKNKLESISIDYDKSANTTAVDKSKIP